MASRASRAIITIVTILIFDVAFGLENDDRHYRWIPYRPLD
ncbi:hypothetical protein [Nocardioides immobilis]|nr:hypothetical protein [Nocardioides immobilis]